jgi:hypothetical protein
MPVGRTRWSGFSRWCAAISNFMRSPVIRRACTRSAVRFSVSLVAYASALQPAQPPEVG